MGGLLKGPDPSGAVYWAPNLLIGVPRWGCRAGSRPAVAFCGFLSFPLGFGSVTERLDLVQWEPGISDWERICMDLFWGGSSGSGALPPLLCGSKSPWVELGGT